MTKLGTDICKGCGHDRDCHTDSSDGKTCATWMDYEKGEICGCVEFSVHELVNPLIETAAIQDAPADAEGWERIHLVCPSCSEGQINLIVHFENEDEPADMIRVLDKKCPACGIAVMSMLGEQ